MFPATVDITRQMAPLLPYPGMDLSSWYQDIFAKVMQLGGYLNIYVGNAPPGDTRKIWYQVANPPNGSPGSPYVYDTVADDWVPLSPMAFITYLSIVPRARDFVQPNEPTTDQNALPGDWWLCTNDGRLSRYITLSSGYSLWLDVTGATLDGPTILALQSKAVKTFATLPAANTVTGLSMIITDAATGLIGSIVAGSGSNTYTVTSDGTNWRVG